MVAFHGHQQPFEGIQDYFIQLLGKEIYGLIKQGTGSAKVVGREIQLSGLQNNFSDPRFYVTVAPLTNPRVSDAKAGIPYIAVVALKEPEHGLDEQEQDFLKRFVLELRRVLCFEDEFKHTRGMVDLLQKFLSLSTPTEVADSMVDYLCKTFKASEVAVLERQHDAGHSRLRV